MIPRCLGICLLGGLISAVNSGQTAPLAQRPSPPTRDPNTAGYVAAKELPDGINPPANADGNFILGRRMRLRPMRPRRASLRAQ